jgi:phospholipid transport system substrate-binding protein
MKTFRRSLPFLAVLTAVLPSWGAASTQAPEDFLKAGIDRVLAVAYAQSGDPLVTRLKPVLSDIFTFDGITRRAVGPAWRGFTPAQQAQITELFTELVMRTYAERFDPVSPVEISYGQPVDLGRNQVEIPTVVTYSGSNFAVIYRLQPEGGSWRVFDIIAEGVSLVGNYRAQFDSIVNRGGAPALIRSLQDNLAATPLR